jgi:hypothetical protein
VFAALLSFSFFMLSMWIVYWELDRWRLGASLSILCAVIFAGLSAFYAFRTARKT